MVQNCTLIIANTGSIAATTCNVCTVSAKDPSAWQAHVGRCFQVNNLWLSRPRDVEVAHAITSIEPSLERVQESKLQGRIYRNWLYLLPGVPGGAYRFMAQKWDKEAMFQLSVSCSPEPEFRLDHSHLLHFQSLLSTWCFRS